jgi:ribosome-binding ATPase YchF (GTP1/OBG family)
MPLSVGIVGKPNVGKSTFFNASTLAMVEVASYPFTTIKPNRGIGYLRTKCVCKEYNVEDSPVNSKCYDGVRLIPVELIDTAGLVPDAWQGRGLGNQFLDEIRRADALIHIVDVSGSTDLEGRTIKPGMHDPVEDIHFLEREITMWYAQIIKRDWQKIIRTIESKKIEFYHLLEVKLSGLSVNKEHIIKALRKTNLNSEKPKLWNDHDFMRFVDVLRGISKPMLIAANKIDLPTAEENIERLKKLEYLVIPCSAKAEFLLRRATLKKVINYLPGDSIFERINSTNITGRQKKALDIIREKIFQKYGSTGIQETINSAFFKLLKMIVVYTVEDVEKLSDHKGRILPDVRLVIKGTTARELAYKIHTELGENFIYAIDAHSKRRHSEDYILKDNDVISIVSSKKRF